MQLTKKIVLPLSVIATTSTPTILNAAATDSISLTHMAYRESDDRIDIDFTLLDFKKDFGTDYSLGVSLSHDTITGGTPVWDSISGGSGGETSDASTGQSPCIDQSNNYICKDTRTENIVGDGQIVNADDHAFRNIEITDTRKALSTNLTIRTKSRDEISLGVAYSEEEDFASKEASVGYLYNLDASRNRSIAVGVSMQGNEAKFYRTNDWKDFHIVNFQIGYTQTFTRKLVGQINFFGIKQEGVLTNPYKTIIRRFDVSLNSTPYYKYYISTEKRPDEKTAAGITLNFTSKIFSNVALQGHYRFYNDSWAIMSNTFTTNAYIDLWSGWTLAPLIRYYEQTAASFHKSNIAQDFSFNETDYGSADQRLSAFDSVTYNLGLKKQIQKKLSVKGFVASQHQSYGLSFIWVHLGVTYAL
jgi:hypothetical protein